MKFLYAFFMCSSLSKNIFIIMFDIYIDKMKHLGQKNNNKRKLKIGIKILIKFLGRKIQNFPYIKLKSNTFIRIHLMLQSKRIFFYIKINIF